MFLYRKLQSIPALELFLLRNNHRGPCVAKYHHGDLRLNYLSVCLFLLCFLVRLNREKIDPHKTDTFYLSAVERIHRKTRPLTVSGSWSWTGAGVAILLLVIPNWITLVSYVLKCTFSFLPPTYAGRLCFQSWLCVCQSVCICLSVCLCDCLSVHSRVYLFRL